MSLDKLFSAIECLPACRLPPSSPRDPSIKRSLCASVSLLLLLLSSSLLLLWVGWWRAFRDNDRLNLLNYFYENLGSWFDWIRLLFGLSLVTLLYSLLTVVAVVVVLHRKRLRGGNCCQFDVHPVHFVVSLLGIAGSLAAVFLFDKLYSEGWDTLRLAIVFSSVGLHLGAIALLTVVEGCLLQLVALRELGYYGAKSRRCRYLYLETAFVSLLLLISYILPFIFVGHPTWMPCVRDSLPPKPKLMGHKGALKLAPENTPLSFITAVREGSHGFESDLQMSWDDEPFMFHDKFLTRTTNIEQVFTNPTDLTLSSLTSEQIRSLNAGQWFLDRDPSNSFSSGLIPSSSSSVRNQSIPSFRDFLFIAKEENQSVVWDFKYVSLYGRNLQRVLTIIAEVGIDPSLVWLDASLSWFPPGASRYYKNNSDAFRWTISNYHDEVDNLDYYLAKNIRNRNVHFSRAFPPSTSLRFAEANVTTNVWVANAEWLYSLLWCTGAVASVTTDSVRELAAMTRPQGFMSPATFRGACAGMIVISIVILVVVVVVTVKCRPRDRLTAESSLEAITRF